MRARGQWDRRKVGLDRVVRLDWLERAVRLSLAGVPPDEARRILRQELRPKFRVLGHARGNSLEKTIAILLRVWIAPRDELADLCSRGIALCSVLKGEQRRPLHWGMLLATYPFWRAVATEVGRLSRLQRIVTLASVRRRIQEAYGERSTIHTAVARAIRSMVDWGVIDRHADAHQRQIPGLYVPARPTPVDRADVILWLAEALLRSLGRQTASIEHLVASPSLFPWSMRPVSSIEVIRQTPSLELLHHGSSVNLALVDRPR